MMLMSSEDNHIIPEQHDAPHGTIQQETISDSTATVTAPEEMPDTMPPNPTGKPVPATNKKRRRTAAAKKKRLDFMLRRVLLLVSLTLFFVSAFFLIRNTIILIRNHSPQNKFEELAVEVHTTETEPEKSADTSPDDSAGVSTGSDTQSVPAESEETVAESGPAASEAPEDPQILPQYAALYARNPDLYGWISIEDTVLDYPVMYAPDETDKYLYADFDGRHSEAGSPFIDEACTDQSDNLIIYAHNMNDGSMFHEIMNYESEDYWREHPTIRFDTLYEEQEYEVLAAFRDRVYRKSDTCFKFYQFINAADEADFDNAMANYREKQLYDTGVDASYGDELITLVTCAYHEENGRFVVVAKKK